jgi:hypothetical protein
MSFLSRKNSEFLSARLTQKGRKSIAQGDFQIKFFQIGDSEFDYTSPFNLMDGVQTNPNQVVLSPFDKDSQVKYPYLLDSATESTTYGVPIMDSITETIRNGMGPAGFVSDYFEYDSTNCSGTTIECSSVRIPFSGTTQNEAYISGNTISFIETLEYVNCSGSTIDNDGNILDTYLFYDTEFITVVFNNEFIGEDQVVTGNSSSLIYKITNITTVTGTTNTPNCQTITGRTTLTLDRYLPDFNSNGDLNSKYVQIVKNKCKIEHPLSGETSTACVSNQVDPSDQHDPWTLNVVWKEKPIGSDVDETDENITGYTSSKHISTMEYLGYGSSSGQTTGYTGTTYSNSYGETITVEPEEQKCIAIIHYSELGHIYDDPDRFFKYDDYIGSSTTEGVLVDEELVTDVDFFNIYIPFVYYENSTGTTMGVQFVMDSSEGGEKTIDSSVAGTPGDLRTRFIRYRDLLDEIGKPVGRVFMDKKIIVFHDQELVAMLDYRSNRRYTLPTPKVYHVPSDSTPANSVFSGTTSQTFWVTYMLEYTGDTQLNSLPCNNFTKVQVNVVDGECEITYPANISIKWGGADDHPTKDYINSVGSFQHMKTTFSEATNGYIANRLWILLQETTDETNILPDPSQWFKIDITDRIGLNGNGLIDPTNLRDNSFIITGSDISSADLFDLEDYLENTPTDSEYLGDDTNPSSLPQFGDEQPFPGHVKLVRCSDIEEMRFLVNLPHSQWTTTQNPTYSSGTKYITEVALLNQNKETLITAKTSTPIKRVGTQVISVKIDF